MPCYELMTVSPASEPQTGSDFLEDVSLFIACDFELHPRPPPLYRAAALLSFS